MKWHASLDTWRTDRNISWTPSFIPMIEEELQEHDDAPTIDDTVDAICDVIVITENQARLENSRIDYNKIHESGLPYVEYARAMLHHYTPGQDNTYYFQELYSTSAAELARLGYSLSLAMKETLKEISSRKQDPIQAYDWQLNGPSGKWLKDPNQDPSTLYKANYNLAKLKRDGV